MGDQHHAPSGHWKTVLLLVLLVVAVTALWVWRRPLWGLFSNQDQVQAWISSFGPWAPVSSVLLNAAQVLLAPIPGQVVQLANGYVHGAWLGTLYSMLGLLLGTALAMALARRFGRPLVERLADPARLVRWDRLAARQGPWFFFLVFLIPGLPDDMVCFVIGLSALPLPRMVVLALLGRLPGVVVSCWVGANAAALDWWVWIPLGLGTGALAWAFWRYRDSLEATLTNSISQLTRRLRPSRQPRGTEEEAGPAPEQEGH